MCNEVWEPVPDMDVDEYYLPGNSYRRPTRNNGTEFFDWELNTWEKLPEGWCIMRKVTPVPQSPPAR